jgi:hypothetical protein
VVQNRYVCAALGLCLAVVGFASVVAVVSLDEELEILFDRLLPAVGVVQSASDLHARKQLWILLLGHFKQYFTVEVDCLRMLNEDSTALFWQDGRNLDYLLRKLVDLDHVLWGQ